MKKGGNNEFVPFKIFYTIMINGMNWIDHFKKITFLKEFSTFSILERIERVVTDILKL